MRIAGVVADPRNPGTPYTPGVPNQDLTPLLRDRCSPRVFDPSHVLTAAELELLLEAARWAPSAGNSQPWAFLIGLRGDAAHAEICSHLSRGNSGWVPRASAVLISACRIAAEPDDSGEPVPSYSDYAQYDVGQAVAHLTVQATALGLSVHQFAGFNHEALTTAFDIPPHWKVTTGIAIGKIGDPTTTDIPEREPTDRNPLSEFSFGGRWGSPVLG
jgi:nitroreductase